MLKSFLIASALSLSFASASGFVKRAHPVSGSLELAVPDHELVSLPALVKRDASGCGPNQYFDQDAKMCLCPGDDLLAIGPNCITVDTCEEMDGLRVTSDYNRCVCENASFTYFPGLCQCQKPAEVQNNEVLNLYRNYPGCPSLRTIHIGRSCVPRVVCPAGQGVGRDNQCLACRTKSQASNTYPDGRCRPNESFTVKKASRLVMDASKPTYATCEDYKY